MKAILALLGLITCTLTLSHATDPTEPHTIDPLQVFIYLKNHTSNNNKI